MAIKLYLPKKKFPSTPTQFSYWAKTPVEGANGAEVPVPDWPMPRQVCLQLVMKMKLSQKIGCLLWLNQIGKLSPGGGERLLYLQQKASLEAIGAGTAFAIRLRDEAKFRKDFSPHMDILNRRPQSRRFRVREKSRIGVGYRDKGTLPCLQTQARNLAQQEAAVWVEDVNPILVDWALELSPDCLSEDGRWLYLGDLLLQETRGPTYLPPL